MPIIYAGQPPPIKLSNAHLVLLSKSITAEQLTERIGLAADKSWRPGERRSPIGNAVHKLHGWEIASKASEADGPDRHLSALLERLRPYAGRVAAVLAEGRDVEGRLWLTHRIENWNPGMTLGAPILRDIAAMGVSLEIDIYCYEPGELGADRQTGPTH